jgi:hypothetical protein
MSKVNPSTRSSTDSIANETNDKATVQENVRPKTTLSDTSPPTPTSKTKPIHNLIHQSFRIATKHPPRSTISAQISNDLIASPPNPLQPDLLASPHPSFNPTNTTDTTVNTTVGSAVTHETPPTKRVEVVQQATTCDIRIDHDHHYIRPVKVVEVSPARYFTRNSKGEKVSIAARRDGRCRAT